MTKSMRMEWVNKKGQGRVVVFFNGWGMDEKSISHLSGENDLLLCFDYRHIGQNFCPELSGYKEIYLIAWSMGVWAAANIVGEWNIKFTGKVALNGTECPIDGRYGIPPQIYQLTEQGMDEKGREKFFTRMLNGAEEKRRFENNKPSRLLAEQIEELYAIEKQCSELKRNIKWDKIFISEKDVIFPVNNQLNWWCNRADITMLPTGHYPFYYFSNWEEIWRK